jgi:BCS1 N terminal
MHNLLETLNQNPFFSGGLSLMVLGASAALLRRVPAQIWSFLERRLTIAVEVTDRDPAFRWVQTWLANQRYARRARDLSLTTTWVNPDRVTRHNVSREIATPSFAPDLTYIIKSEHVFKTSLHEVTSWAIAEGSPHRTGPAPADTTPRRSGR